MKTTSLTKRPSYRSGFEDNLHQHNPSLLSFYETQKIFVTIILPTVPDYVITDMSGQVVRVMEAKGRIRNQLEKKKVIATNEYYKSLGIPYVMILESSRTKALGSKRLTLRSWCVKNDILVWCSDKRYELPKILLECQKTTLTQDIIDNAI